MKQTRNILLYVAAIIGWQTQCASQLADQFVTAAQTGTLQQMQALHASGAQLNGLDQEGYTALHTLLYSTWAPEAYEKLAWLARERVQIRKEERDLLPKALMQVAAVGQVNIAEQFLMLGVNPNVYVQGGSALARATGCGCVPLVRLLLQHGAGSDGLQFAATAIVTAFMANDPNNVITELVSRGDVILCNMQSLGANNVARLRERQDHIRALLGEAYTLPHDLQRLVSTFTGGSFQQVMHGQLALPGAIA